MSNQLTKHDIIAIIQQVFETMLGLSIVDCGDCAEELSSGQVSMATICISGGWNGIVVLQCTRKIADKVAQVMFQMDAESISSDETKDALGEIINMIGGNLKALLPGPSSLSLPNVVLGTDCSWDVPGGKTLFTAGMQCDGELLSANVVEEEKN